MPITSRIVSIPRVVAIMSTLAVSALMLPVAMAGDMAGERASAAPPSTTGSAVVDQSVIPQAPTGHRQPRADDFPAGTTGADANADDAWINRINRDTDRKLHICRSC